MVYFHVIRVTKRNTVVALLLLVILTCSWLLYQELARKQEVMALSWALRHKVIVIDPGHGGMDPGAIGPNGTKEKEVTLQISKKLAFALSQAGATVILTRDGDYDLSDDATRGTLTKKRQDLKRRVEMANERKADVYLSIHLNAYPSPKLHGAQTFYQKNQEGGKVLAEFIQGELQRVVKTTRVAKGMDFYTNRSTKMPAVTVEVGFVSNPEEEQKLINDRYQNQLVWAIFSGLIKYFEGE